MGRKRIYEDNSEKCKAYRERKKLEERMKIDKEHSEYRQRLEEQKLSTLTDTEKSINAVNQFLKEEDNTLGIETVDPETLTTLEGFEDWCIENMDSNQYAWVCLECHTGNFLLRSRCRHCGSYLPDNYDEALEGLISKYPFCKKFLTT